MGMEKTIEIKAIDKEKALKRALNILGVELTENEAVEIVEKVKPRKKFFGLFGTEPGTYEISIKTKEKKEEVKEKKVFAPKTEKVEKSPKHEKIEKTEKNDKVEVSHKNNNEKPAETINIDEFITVKGIKTIGNQFIKEKVKSINVVVPEKEEVIEEVFAPVNTEIYDNEVQGELKFGDD